MSFLIGPIVRGFLAQQAYTLIQREISEELRARKEEPKHGEKIDFAILFSQKSEMAGLQDRCPRTKATHGNNVTFHTAVFQKKRFVMTVTENLPEQVTETVIDIFRPKRIITAGFAYGLVPGMKKNSLFVPHRIVDAATGNVIDLWQQSLLDGTKSENHSKNDNYFQTGILVSSKTGHFCEPRYDGTALDENTYSVLNVCRQWNIPCLPVKIITEVIGNEKSSAQRKVSPRVGFARKLGMIFRETFNDPASLLKSVNQYGDHLIAGDILGKHLLKLFFSEQYPH